MKYSEYENLRVKKHIFAVLWYFLVIKWAEQNLYFLRKLKQASHPSLLTIYNIVVESVYQHGTSTAI